MIRRLRSRKPLLKAKYRKPVPIQVELGLADRLALASLIEDKSKSRILTQVIEDHFKSISLEDQARTIAVRAFERWFDPESVIQSRRYYNRNLQAYLVDLYHEIELLNLEPENFKIVRDQITKALIEKGDEIREKKETKKCK